MPKRNPGIDVSVLARATCDPGRDPPRHASGTRVHFSSYIQNSIAHVLRIRSASTMRIVRPLESPGTDAQILQYGFNGNWKLHRATRVCLYLNNC